MKSLTVLSMGVLGVSLSTGAALLGQSAPVAVVPAQAPPASAASAPTPPAFPAAPPGVAVAAPAGVGAQGNPFYFPADGAVTFFGGQGSAGPDLHGKSLQQAKQLTDAKDEAEKAKLRGELAKTLDELFDQQAQHQAKEVADLESQIKKLRSALDKRLANKATIVQRRMEQLLQDADGLGWNAPAGDGRRGMFGTGGFGGMSGALGGTVARRATATKAVSGTPAPASTTTPAPAPAVPSIPPVSR
ncbi:MAG TPA: hypothetical protein VNC50_03190 [Planctomycetia bacterium]|nr:hypothetical protein [Planctomycetia bacterium]